MGVFNFFSERLCFVFCFFHVHEDAPRFIVSGRLLKIFFFRFWDIIWLGDEEYILALIFSPHSWYKKDLRFLLIHTYFLSIMIQNADHFL